MSVLKKTVKRKNLYKEYVRLLNGLLQLSDREVQILSILIMMDTEWRPKMSADYKNVLSTDNRRLIMKETLINKNNLSKYIKKIKDAGLIQENEDGGWEVVKMIRPNFDKNKVNLSFILEIEKDAD